MTKTAVIGKRLQAIDALGKTTGQTVYLQDMRVPGLLYGKVLRSPHPHARVVSVDISRAERLPGVKAVVGGRNAPRIPFGIIQQDELPVAVDRVRYVGDEVAVVAAISEEIAAEALGLIRVEYEPLPAVFDVQEALRPGGPQLHDAAPGNLAVHFKLERGDVDGAFQRSDCVIEAEYTTSIQHQGNLEPICCLAEYQNGRLTIWGPFQSPFLARQYLIAKPLGLPEGRVRLIQTTVGGAFGGKLDQRLYVLAGLLALRAGAPVRLENTFAEELSTTRPRMPARIRFKTGFSRDGLMLVKQTGITADNGAYSSLSPPILTSMSMRTDSLYRTPAVRMESRLVYTNNLPSGQMRGFGNPQATFAFESHLDTVADALGIDPVELRLKNATQSGETSVHGWRMASCGYADCVREAARRIGWPAKRGPVGTGRGVGLAGTIHVTSNKPFATAISGHDWDGSNALVRLNEDGTVSLFTGEVDLGEGVATTLAMVVAEELGLPHDRVFVYPVDTDVSPYCLGTYASRTTFMGGLAARNAARDARDQLFAIAAELLQAVPGDLEARDGEIRLKGEPSRRVPLGEAVRAGFNRGMNAITGRGSFTSKIDFQPTTKYGNQTLTYSFACHAAEVEVDRETGAVRVLKIAAVHDLGRVINRLGAEGQVEGGAIQSLGLALSEQLLQRDGKVLNPNFVDYRIPSSLDAPPIDVAFVETVDPYGPHGAKGLAETAINPTAAAIANAVCHATGVRVRDLPLTAEKVLAGLAELRRSGDSGH
jgi:CO/xanthine dehydrogenase Mo-binding subunit